MHKKTEEKPLYEIPIQLFPIFAFVALEGLILFFSIRNNGLEGILNLKILGLLFFTFLFYMVCLFALCTYAVYESRIEIYSPFRLNNRRVIVEMKSLDKVMYNDAAKGPSYFTFYLKNGKKLIRYFYTAYVYEDKLDEIIKYFKNHNIPVYKWGWFKHKEL